jgi:hypothetical protein
MRLSKNEHLGQKEIKYPTGRKLYERGQPNL